MIQKKQVQTDPVAFADPGKAGRQMAEMANPGARIVQRTRSA